MRKAIKSLSMAVVVFMLMAVILSGCGTKDTSTESASTKTESTATAQPESTAAADTVDTSKEVALKMYLLGDKPVDTDLVYAEVNKLMKQDINATVSLSFLSWGDWQQKYPLIFASGEDFDLVYTANWAQYNQQSTKGAFLELTQDMLKKYAPKTAETMYPAAWEQAKINGKVFMLPMNFKEIHGKAIMYRGDIMEKYGVQAPTKVQDQAAYYDACLKEGGIIPTNIGSDLSWNAMPVPNILNPTWLFLEAGGVNGQYYYDSTNTKELKLVDYYNTEEYVQAAKLAKEWADKGYWSKSALVNKVPTKDSFVAGKSGDVGGNLSTMNSFYPTVAKSHPEWKVQVFDTYYGGAIDVKPYIQNGVAINKNSKNPERALMMLDLFRNDPRYFDLTFYGIKGKHYDLAADGKSIVPLADSGNFGPESCCPWGWRNDSLVRGVQGGVPNYDELRSAWSAKAVSHPIQNFNFDDTKVKNELAAVNNVQKQFGRIIDFGFAKDVDKAIADYRAKLKAAGRDKITAEMQAQIDAFMAENGK